MMEEIEDLPYSLETGKNGSKDSNENLSTDKLYNDTPEWMDIIGSGGLKKKIIKEGICESRPAKGDSVKIKATGRLEDGTEVEVLEDFIFTVGDGEVISGLDLVVVLMDKGEVSEIYMEARFAYGEKGLDSGIPPNSSLYYVVHLIDFKPEDDPENLILQERLEIGIRKRERGNWWFKRDESQQAIKCYKAAVDFLDDTSDTYGENISPELREMLNERLKTLNNMAAAQMKIEAYDIALKSLEAILKCQPNNLKALFRKGKILGIQGEVREGLETLLEALEIDPDSKVIQSEVAKLREKARQMAQSERSLYRRMLGLKPDKNTRKEKDRYPTLRGVPVKLWASIFVVLLSLLFAIKCRESILSSVVSGS